MRHVTGSGPATADWLVANLGPFLLEPLELVGQALQLQDSELYRSFPAHDMDRSGKARANAFPSEVCEIPRVLVA
jgi:hypothetical protein